MKRMPIRKISSTWMNTSEDTTPQAGLSLRSFSLKKTTQKITRKMARMSSPATILPPFYVSRHLSWHDGGECVITPLSKCCVPPLCPTFWRFPHLSQYFRLEDIVEYRLPV